ncbi:MAG: ArsA-related P-loop ATPase [Actinomycetota bacterium]
MAAAASAALRAPTDSTAAVPGIRLHVVTGKGGVGKTTVAAAMALALAEGGRRVLLVEVEGRQALAQLFDVPALAYTERRLATASGGGEVVGLAIDPEQALMEYLAMFYNLKRAGRLLRRMGAIDFATTIAPGLRDVLLTGKVKEAVTRLGKDRHPVYDSVVLDAPPTGRIRQFLDATTEVAKLTKVGPISRHSAGVISLLHGPLTAVHIVTVLEEMPVQETIEAATDLAAAGFGLGAVIVNRVRPTLVASGQVGARGAVDTTALGSGLAAAGVDAAFAELLGRQMAEYANRQRLQRRNASLLHTIDRPRLELPDLKPPVDLGELKELASHVAEVLR